MKALCLVFALAAFLPSAAVAYENPVVVELFTSEGCSSCPPADALLVQLSQMKAPNGAEIIVLGEHVDYWDNLGWKDRFSSPVFTKEQQGYVDRFGLATAYTPQMVVDGTVQFVGNDKTKLIQAIFQQSRQSKPVTLKLRLEGETDLHISAQAPGIRKPVVIFAITEDHLTTEVADGENRGRTLSHAGVVRKLARLNGPRNGELDQVVPIHVERDWERANLKAVVLIRAAPYGPIVGAASIPLSSSAHAATETSAK